MYRFLSRPVAAIDIDGTLGDTCIVRGASRQSRKFSGESSAKLFEEIGVHRNAISWAARNKYGIRRM